MVKLGEFDIMDVKGKYDTAKEALLVFVTDSSWDVLKPCRFFSSRRAQFFQVVLSASLSFSRLSISPMGSSSKTNNLTFRAHWCRIA